MLGQLKDLLVFILVGSNIDNICYAVETVWKHTEGKHFIRLFKLLDEENKKTFKVIKF